MRDWRSGDQWDTRTLWELDGFRLRAVCKFCRHIGFLSPNQVRHKQPRRYHWRLIQQRLRCSVCEKRVAELRVEPALAMNREPAERDRP